MIAWPKNKEKDIQKGLDEGANAYLTKPFSMKKLIQEIEKGIMKADLGFNPMNNGDLIIINVPPLTEERRRDLVKQAKAEAEDAKIGVRNARQEANKEIKALGLPEDVAKDAEASVQELTNKYSKKIEELLTVKEAEIMKV